MRVAVVGHVEWVRFVDVDKPPTPGAILRAERAWDEPAGGGGVAAAELARLAGGCTLFTALGSDEAGRRSREMLEQLGVTVRAAIRSEPQRQAVTMLDPDAERTILVIGPAQQPEASDGLTEADFAELDAVYFCKGAPEVLRAARAARVLVATARVLPTLRAAGVRVDVLVRSGRDPDEAFAPDDLAVAPGAVVTTDGERGGHWTSGGASGHWQAAALPGEVRDAYGAGDSFAAALTFGLGQGRPFDDALRFAAERGALALCRSGAHGNELPNGKPGSSG